MAKKKRAKKSGKKRRSPAQRAATANLVRLNKAGGKKRKSGRKKARKSGGQIPLSILKKRLGKLQSVIYKRGG